MADTNSSFTRKQIETKITLREGSFGGKGNTITIKGLPTKVKVSKQGGKDPCKGTVEIAGLKYDTLDQLTTLAFAPLKAAKNLIQVSAGDEEHGLNVVFQGEITEATADFNQAPNIWLKLECQTGFYALLEAKGPTTINGNQPAATFIEQQCKAMGYTFRNDGVTSQLKNSVFNGSPIEQAQAAANEVGADFWIEDNVAVLSPRGEKKGKAFKLNKDTGLLGYPKLSNEGVQVEALFNAEFHIGSVVELKSIVPKASGNWYITKVEHELVANSPDGGPWKSSLTLFYNQKGPAKK